MSNFQKVQEFNTAFGMNRQVSENQLFDDSPESKALLKLRLDLITEEVDELKEAIETKDFTEIRDALADILYVVYGAADSFAIDADADFAIVHNSNMSKLCISEEEAQKTVENYKKMYQEGTSPYDTPYYAKLPNMEKWVIKNKSTGKALKNINYNKVKFE